MNIVSLPRIRASEYSRPSTSGRSRAACVQGSGRSLLIIRSVCVAVLLQAEISTISKFSDTGRPQTSWIFVWAHDGESLPDPVEGHDFGRLGHPDDFARPNGLRLRPSPAVIADERPFVYELHIHLSCPDSKDGSLPKTETLLHHLWV
jgi:hypothetical protein